MILIVMIIIIIIILLLSIFSFFYLPFYDLHFHLGIISTLGVFMTNIVSLESLNPASWVFDEVIEETNHYFSQSVVSQSNDVFFSHF